MGPKRLPQYFATPTHKLRRGLPPGQSVCPILGAPQKKTAIFSWPQLAIAASAVWAAELEAFQ
jgi:hypothetical protein